MSNSSRNSAEGKNIYRLQPEYVLPLTVVKNGFGYLLFSGNKVGREGFKACIQHVADHYFDPHYDMGRLDIYEWPRPGREAAAPYRHGIRPLPPLPGKRVRFFPSPPCRPSALPEGFTEGRTPLYSHPLHPDAERLRQFHLTLQG